MALEPSARAAIDGHVRLLLPWNAAINLTAIRDPAAVAVRHVIDSLTGLRVLRDRTIDRFVDIGSGGGFPGLTLATVIPSARVQLVESVAKKARFLDTVVAATGLGHRVEVLPIRAEALATDGVGGGRWQAATARAVAPLADLIELAFPVLEPGGCLIAWKSASAVEGGGSERAAADRAIAAIDPAARLAVEPALPGGVLDPASGDLASLADHRLVVVTRSDSSLAGRWPRDPAARRRAPW